MANKFTALDFSTAYATVSELLSAEDGLFEKVVAKFKEDFDTGGLSNEQTAMAKAQFYSQAYNTLETQVNNSVLKILESAQNEALLNQQIASASAQELLTTTQKTELISNGAKDRELTDSQIALSGSQKDLTDTEKSETELNGIKQRSLTDSQISLNSSQKELVNAQKLDANASTSIKYQQEIAEKIRNGSIAVTYIYSYYSELESQWYYNQSTTDLSVITNAGGTITSTVYTDGDGISQYELEKQLVSAKAVTEVRNQNVLYAQRNLIIREEGGYSDNIAVKAAEFDGQVASFAVNADAVNAADVVARFNASIDALKARI